MKNQKIIKPQAGPQEMFLGSQADIAIYGGAAGSGKSWALCLECLRHINNSKFGAVLLRRTSKQVRNEGGLWDRSCEIFTHARGDPRESILQWRFPSGAKVSFAHLEHEKSKYNFDGAEIPYIGFDELIHFSESQFFYLLSRNRSTCGIAPYVRATTNPDSESWVAAYIAWWIDKESGYPIMERSGKLRYFYRVENTIYWYDSKQEAREDQPMIAKQADPKSVTFIAANIHDNPALLNADPNYLSTLQSLPKVERERLLMGNWKIHSEGGNVFDRAWFQFVDEAPKEKLLTVRYWDRAGTENAGCETAGVRMSKTRDGLYFVEDVVKGQWSTLRREQIIRETAERDGKRVHVHFEQEPGSAGIDSAAMTKRNLAGFTVRADRVTGDKVERARPFASQVEAGNVYLVKAEWNRVYLDQLHGFPDLKLKDMVDASSGAFNVLADREYENFGELFKVTARREDSMKEWNRFFR